jgi:uncharacterized GH25 family protein
MKAKGSECFEWTLLSDGQWREGRGKNGPNSDQCCRQTRTYRFIILDRPFFDLRAFG